MTETTALPPPSGPPRPSALAVLRVVRPGPLPLGAPSPDAGRGVKERRHANSVLDADQEIEELADRCYDPGRRWEE